MMTISQNRFLPPVLSLPDLDALEWKSMAEMIRFRENSRPKELLDEQVIVKQMGKRQIVLIADPVAAEEILFRRADQFPKAAIQKKLGHAAFGPGLSGTVGAQNQRQRHAFKPLMVGEQVRIMAEVAKEAADAAVSRYLKAGRIDLGYEMAELAMQIIWATLLGPGRYEGRDPIVAEVITELYAHPKGDFISATGIVRRLADHFEESGRWKRLADDNPLAAITNPDGWTGKHPMSQEELRANAVVMAASGHVTTGLTLAWSAWLLGLFPDDQRRVVQEVDNDEHQESGSFLRQVVNETLRLFPPGAETMRDALSTMQVADQTINPGDLVIVSFYALHRHHRLWQNPDAFQPQRFAAESPEPVMPTAFLPFSGGPGGCLGERLAWAEMLAVLGTLFRHTRVETDPVEADKVGLCPGTCIYPEGALRAQLHPR
ncbi:MAG: cytochrome P450 [Magnetococcales bacterium]|nr:cytochrome P450 [Magnetococcales bacterium]